MIIGINASKAASVQKTGVENTVFQIIKHLRQIDADNIYNLYTDKPLPEDLISKNFIEKLIPQKRLWHRFRLPLALFRDKPDSYLEMSGGAPSLVPSKNYIMIHDLAFRYFPEAYTKKELILQESTIQSAIHRSAKIIVTLQANKADLQKFYDVDGNNIVVVPLALDKESFRKINDPINPLKLNEPFFISVGRLEKRKNTISSIKAFNKLRDSQKGKIYKLVLVGKQGFGYEEIKKEIDASKYTNDIIEAGYLSNQDIVSLFSLAKALIYPSFYEGFGLPILEAFNCELPVITSDAPPLVEVAGNAALVSKPEDYDGIAAHMESLINDHKLRGDCIKKGKERAESFDWKKTAQEIKNILTK